LEDRGEPKQLTENLQHFVSVCRITSLMQKITSNCNSLH